MSYDNWLGSGYSDQEDDELTEEELKELEDSEVADAGHLLDDRNYEKKTGERWKDTEYLDYLNV